MAEREEQGREAQRFWSKVDRIAGAPCWLWTGNQFHDGYGQFNVQGRQLRAHRWAYEAGVAPIPEGLVIDHRCRNRLCVNPDHMEPVTNQENVLRGIGISAVNARKIRCIHGHEFTTKNTRIRPDGSRACRECGRLREQARRDRAKTA